MTRTGKDSHIKKTVARRVRFPTFWINSGKAACGEYAGKPRVVSNGLLPYY